MSSRASATNCHVNCEVSIMLHCQPSSTCYTALRIKKCLKSTFAAVKVATMKNTDNFCFKRKLPHATTKSTLSLSVKMNGTQKRTLVSPRRKHCMYYGIPKGTCPAEAMPNGTKIKPITLAVIKLHLSEGISQPVSQLVEKFHLTFFF